MKKLYLFFAAVLAVSAMCRAENYFVPGTVWKYEMLFGYATEYETITLVETDKTASEGIYQPSVHISGEDALGNPNPDRDSDGLGYLIKVDGEKIYKFNHREEAPEWDLIYDFSLAPGELCTIREERYEYTEDGHPILGESYLTFKYVGNTFNKEYNTTVMEMKVFRSEEESTDDANAIATEQWIPGIGSIRSFYGSYYYPTEPEAGGVLERLRKVTDAQGNVIVEFSKDSAIEAVEAAGADAPVECFDLQGRRVEHPANGIFIEKKGNEVRKVAL